jgi:hypothetical protein
MSKGSDKPQRILEYIQTYQQEHGYSPSFIEIARALGISGSNVVSYNIDLLVKAGKLEKTYYVARSLRVVGSESDVQTPTIPQELQQLKEAAKPFVDFWFDLVIGKKDEDIIAVRTPDKSTRHIKAGDIRRLRKLIEG